MALVELRTVDRGIRFGILSTSMTSLNAEFRNIDRDIRTMSTIVEWLSSLEDGVSETNDSKNTTNRKHRRAVAKPPACANPLMLSTIGPVSFIRISLCYFCFR